MTCGTCERVNIIEDKGYVYIRPFLPSAAKLLESHAAAIENRHTYGVIEYETKEQLLEIMHLLESLPGPDREQLSLHVSGKRAAVPEAESYVSLQNYFARMENSHLVSIIRESRFASHLQPIVSAQDHKVFGYEFLLRPASGGAPFRPFELFEVARNSGLHSFLDRAARISAIETSARLLQKGTKRFINFLPSSIYNPNYCLSHTFAAVDRLELDAKDMIFEVVETEKIEDIRHLQSIFEVYKKNGMGVALDDVGSGFSTVEVMKLLEPDYIKIDRGIVDRCDESSEKQEQLIRIVESAHSYGGTVLAEGIERAEEFEFCKKAGVELVQGYLFGKPSDRPVEDSVFS